MKPVKQIRIIKGTGLKKIIDLMSDTGFNGKRLAKACQILKSMINDPKCTKFLGLAGALVPAGMGEIIREMISKGWFDVVVSTGANLTHDLVEALGYHHIQGTEKVSDEELRKKGVDRIYDVYMHNRVYEGMEDFVKKLIFDPSISVKELLWLIGSKLRRKSILKTCSDKRVPLFCPAFTDCGLGVQLMFNNEARLDHFKDLREMIDLAWTAKRVGVLILGGGVPKNFILQSLQFTPKGADYAVQITTDIPSPGGLSGAELREGISWGKINPKAKYVNVLCDATIALPIIKSYLDSP